MILNINPLLRIALVSALLLLCRPALAQNETDTNQDIPIKSVMDLFKKADTSTVEKPQKNSMFLMFPTFGLQPANGFTLGFISRYAFRKNPEQKYSSITAGAKYSTKKQLMTYCQNNMYLSNDRLFLSGDWRYYIFSQSNYGLGSDIIPADWKQQDFHIEDLEQPMKYNYLKFHQTASYTVMPAVFVGAGLHIDSYTNIEDELLDPDNNNSTYHYDYSIKHGFDPTGYTVSGYSLNLVYDTRDNIINTYKGLFVNLNYRYNPDFFGNQQPSGTLFTEARYFIPMSRTNKQHVWGFWAFANLLTSGQLPYLNLPSLGWDANTRSGKGYTQGLIRGQNYAYFETEYRFPIMKNQLITGTVFADISTASDADRNLKLFSHFQPAAGVGVRILLDKSTLTNFIINYGRGRDSDTFYFNDGEGF